MSDRDKLQRLLDKVQGMDLGGTGFWKPKEGRNVVRILPPVGDMEFFFVEVGRHYKQKQFCPKIISEGEERCPICDLNEDLWQQGEKDAAADFRASRSFWVNIIDRANEGAGPQIFTPGTQIFGTVVSYIGDEEYGDITDEDDGFDIKIDRAGTGFQDTEYEVRAMRNPSALSDDDDLIDEWIGAAVDLEKRIQGQVLDYDDLIEKAGLEAYFDQGQDDDEEEEVPVVTRKRGGRRRKRRR